MNTELALINQGPAAFAPARRSDESPHMSRTWTHNPLAVFIANGLNAVGGLVVEDGRIVELLGAGQQLVQPCVSQFDASRHAALLGFINTHHHFYQTLTRA